MANFFELFHQATRRFPDRTAIEVIRPAATDTWTYAQLGADADL